MQRVQQSAGRTAIAGFRPLHLRPTPEVLGTLASISGDIIREPQTNRSYYTGTVLVSDVKMRKLEGLKLLPGMSAEVYIKTDHRTPVSYLLKPFNAEMAGAMHEQ